MPDRLPDRCAQDGSKEERATMSPASGRTVRCSPYRRWNALSPRRRLLQAAIMALLALALAALPQRAVRAAPPGSTTDFPTAGTYLVPVSGAPVYLGGHFLDVTWSPDGNYLAGADSNDNLALVVWDVHDRSAPVVLFRSSEQVGDSLAWSRDGRWLASLLPGAGAVRVVNADGSVTRTIRTDHPLLTYTWAPDSQGVTLAEGRGQPPDFEYRVVTVSISDGSELEELLPWQSGICPTWLVWSHDGAGLLIGNSGRFLQSCAASGSAGVWLWDVTAQALQPLDTGRTVFAVDWTADNRPLALVDGGPDGVMLVRFDRASTATVLLTGLLLGEQLSPTGFAYVDAAGVITVIPFDGSGTHQLGPPVACPRLLSLSPDSGTVVWASPNAGGAVDLTIARTDGSGRRTLQSETAVWAGAWAPDGSALLVELSDERPSPADC